MSDYVVIQQTPDVELILIDSIRWYLKGVVDFNEIFPKQGDVRVVADHPFAVLLSEMAQSPDGATTVTQSSSLFPSVVVTAGAVTKNPSASYMAGAPESYTITREILDQIDDLGADYITMSKEGIARLTNLFDTQDDEVRAEGFRHPKRASMSIEVWADNFIVKNRLYDIIEAYLVGRLRKQLNEKGVMLDESAVSGERGGIYNFEFGTMLYGAMFRFNLDYFSSTYVIEAGTPTLIEGAEAEVNPEA